MRRRRMGGRGARRGRAPVNWIVGEGWVTGSGGALLVPLVPSMTVGVPAAPVGAELVGATGAVGFDPVQISRLTVNAVRGDLCIRAPQDAVQAYTLHVGIVVVDTSTRTGPVEKDPSVGPDADAGWMWIRHWIIPPGTNPAYDPLAGSAGYDVNVRSKRKVQWDEALFLYAQVAPINGAITVGVTILPYLRTLVSRTA